MRLRPFFSPAQHCCFPRLLSLALSFFVVCAGRAGAGGQGEAARAQVELEAMQHNMLSESERRDHRHRVARDDLQDQLARHQVLLGELEQQVVTKTDVIGHMQSRLTQSDHRARRLEAGLQGTAASDIIGTIRLAFHSSVPPSHPPCDVALNVVPMHIG